LSLPSLGGHSFWDGRYIFCAVQRKIVGFDLNRTAINSGKTFIKRREMLTSIGSAANEVWQRC